METIAITFTMAATSRGLLQFPATFQRIDADVSAWGWQLSVIFRPGYRDYFPVSNSRGEATRLMRNDREA